MGVLDKIIEIFLQALNAVGLVLVVLALKEILIPPNLNLVGQLIVGLVIVLIASLLTHRYAKSKEAAAIE